ncbi:MAG: helix-turn-helix transcriptional regulator [Sulfobacillus sp.]
MKEADTRQAALGAFIRSHRERLSPPATSHGRRRAPGWRREELAGAAGIGVTWLTWLEQGRKVNASAAVCARLAAALQLNAAERSSLFELADRRDPDHLSAATDALPADLLALPQQIAVPAYLIDYTWTARAWNQQAAELFVGWLDDEARDRNLLNFAFLTDEARTLIVNWAERVSRLVAEFRADFNRHIGDATLQMQVENLAIQSQEFAMHWRAQNVVEREGGTRTFLHPRLGVLHYRQTTLFVPGQQTAKLVCLSKTA